MPRILSIDIGTSRIKVASFDETGRMDTLLSRRLNRAAAPDTQDAAEWFDAAGALLSLAHMMKNEQVHACITVDGPAGPRHQSKEGAFFLANRTNARIMPVRIYVKHALRLPTWDRFQVPLPFSGVTIRFGHAWDEGKKEVPDIEESTMARVSARLEKELHELAVGLIPGVSA